MKRITLNSPRVRRRFGVIGSRAITQVQVRGGKRVWSLISQHGPSLKSKYQVCVVQYLAVTTCQVQRRGKFNTPVQSLCNSVMLRDIHEQGEVCRQLRPVVSLSALFQALRWRDWSCSSAEQSAVSLCWSQDKAKPSRLFAPIATTGTKILIQSHRCQRERKPGESVMSETLRAGRERVS